MELATSKETWEATRLRQEAARAALLTALERVRDALEGGVCIEDSLPMLLDVAYEEAFSYRDERLLFVYLGELLKSRPGITAARYRRNEEAMYFGFAGEVARRRRYDDEDGTDDIRRWRNLG
jgi:hypothetical protein